MGSAEQQYRPYNVYKDNIEEMEQFDAAEIGQGILQLANQQPIGSLIEPRALLKRSSVDVIDLKNDDEDKNKLQLKLTPTAHIHRSLETMKSKSQRSLHGSVADTARSIYSN